MQTAAEWVSPLEGTEFEPQVMHLGTCPAAVEPGAVVWTQILTLTDPAIVQCPDAITLLVIHYDKRFGLLAMLYRELDRQPLLDAFHRMGLQSSSSRGGPWVEFCNAVDMVSTQVDCGTITELVQRLKTLGQQTVAASTA